MTLAELKTRVDNCYNQSERNHSINVCIPNGKGGQGGLSVTDVTAAGRGIDWNSDKFIIWPIHPMIEK